MRLVSFTHQQRSSYGVVIGTGEAGDPDAIVADVGAVLGGRHRDLDSVLAARAVDEVATAAVRAPRLPMADVVLTIPTVLSRIFCIGINYKDHRDETGRDPLAHPTVFVRFASSLAAPGATLEHPQISERFDYEGELAVVIGAPGRHIAANDALAHVGGYSCFNDGSVRDWQRYTGQFTPGKNFDRSGSYGPWIVTADEIGDPAMLTLTTRVDGEVMQQSRVDLLLFDIPALIAYLSTFCELLAGDVIATGTPGGVGMARTPPRWLQAGEVVEVDIDKIGVLRNVVGNVVDPEAAP